MKRLIVGGAHQGKRAYAEFTYGLTAEDFSPQGTATDHLHLQVRELVERGEDAKTVLLEHLRSLDSWVVICDEIGCGVVPVDALEREWREQTGRLCAELAKAADTVERLCCGIPVRLKG